MAKKKEKHTAGDVRTRYEGLPAGFKTYTGGGCPFPSDAKVEHAVRTAEGIGITPPQRVLLHDWEWLKNEPEIGDVVGYRVPA